MATKSLSLNLLGALTTLALAACGGGDVEVRGKVTDGDGQQQRQGLSMAPSLGGNGTVQSATKVKASTVAASGTLELVAEADVQAGGTYSLALPEGTERVVLEAVDAQGQVLASALLDAAVTAKGESARVAPPMSSETSLEAQVYVRMVVDGAAPETVDTVDLRSRIDLQTAVETRKQAAQDQAAAVVTLAQAVRAAQDAEVKAYAKAGVETTQAALFDSSLEASATLDAALDAGSQSAAQAYADFFAAVGAATDEVDEKQEAEGERAASASFRVVAKARLSGGDLRDAAVRSASLLEARVSAAALEAVLKAAKAPEPVLARAHTAYATLVGKLATSGSDQARAWTEYRTALSANTDASVLGSFLSLGASGDLSLDVALTATATADNALRTGAGAALELGRTASMAPSLLADEVVKAYGAYHTLVRAQAGTLAGFGDKADTSVEVLVVASGHVEV